MERLWTIGAGLLLALSCSSYYAAWQCHRHPDRSGWWLSPLVGHVYSIVILGSMSFLLAWIYDAGEDNLTGVLTRAGIALLCLLLQFPFVNYHVADYFASRLRGEVMADTDPTDDFQRAQLAEQRGETRSAVGQYSLIIKHDPLHTPARLRLAELLAGSRRAAQAEEVVRSVLKRDDLPDADRGELSALLMKWETDGVVAEAPKGPGREMRPVTTARMEAHGQAEANSMGSEDPIEMEDA